MATVANTPDLEEEEKKEEPGAAPKQPQATTAAQPASASAAGSPTTNVARGKGTSSGSFTDFGKYSAANKNNIGQQTENVATNLTDQYGAARKGLQQAGQQMRSDVEKTRINEAQGWLGKGLTEADRGSLKTARDWQQGADRDIRQRSDLTGAASQAERNITRTTDQSGKRDALRNLVNTKGGTNYTSGENRFDAALMGRDRQANQKFRDLSAQYQDQASRDIADEQSAILGTQEAVRSHNREQQRMAKDWISERRKETEAAHRAAQDASRSRNFDAWNEARMNKAAQHDFYDDLSLDDTRRARASFDADMGAVDSQFSAQLEALRDLGASTDFGTGRGTGDFDRQGYMADLEGRITNEMNERERIRLLNEERARQKAIQDEVDRQKFAYIGAGNRGNAGAISPNNFQTGYTDREKAARKKKGLSTYIDPNQGRSTR